jgi:hypothetical protein
MNNEDDEYLTVSERHHQLMMDGERFFRRLFWGCMGIVVLVVGTVIFLLFKFHPFWKYP